ncbi:MAG: hypothetical protein ABIG60_03910, partial [Patescibacteria group bacterium]
MFCTLKIEKEGKKMEEEATDFRRYSLGNRVFVYSIYLLVAVSLSISFYHYYPFDDLFVIATFLLTAGGIFFVFCIPIYIIHVIIVNNEKDSLKDYYCSLGDEIVFLQRSKLIRNFKSFKIPGKDKELENLFKFIGKISNQLRDVFSDDLKKLNRVKAKANLLDN